jgi:hypothetical protein
MSLINGSPALNDADPVNGRTSVLAQASIATLALSNLLPSAFPGPSAVPGISYGVPTQTLLSAMSNGSGNLGQNNAVLNQATQQVTTGQGATSLSPNSAVVTTNLTVAPLGAGYTGGATLARPWQGPSGINYAVTLNYAQPFTNNGQPAGYIPGAMGVPGCCGQIAQAQVLYGCTFTFGSTTWSCPATDIVGTPTNQIIASIQT